MKRLWPFILHNFDNLLVIAISIFAAVFGLSAQAGLLAAISATLGLLAYGTIRDRMARETLEKEIKGLQQAVSVIDSQFLDSGQFRSRAQLARPEELAPTALEIATNGVSGITLIVNHLGFFEQRMKAGCKLRFILLDPNSTAMEAWNLLSKVSTSAADVRNALEILKGLIQLEKAKGRCEVRLSKVIPPFSMLIMDPDSDNGLMIVEFYTYKTNLTDRPHVKLRRAQNRHWFDFFRAQFEQIWAESEKWTP